MFAVLRDGLKSKEEGFGLPVSTPCYRKASVFHLAGLQLPQILIIGHVTEPDRNRNPKHQGKLGCLNLVLQC